MWPFSNTKLIRSLGKTNKYTPDINEVEDSPYKLVFLCDDTQKGYINHDKIAGVSSRVSRGFSQQPFDYRVTKHTGRAVPFMGSGLKVKGQVYAMQSKAIPVLDNHYRNGVEFARVRINAIITDADHRIISIGSEHLIRRLPPGMIKTVPELGIRHYTSNPMAGLLGCYMYVAMKSYWDEADTNLLRNPVPEFPKNELVWLPKYYRYPTERNRCPPK